MGTNENMSNGETLNPFFGMDCYEYLDLLKDDNNLSEALLYVDVINDAVKLDNTEQQNEMMQMPKYESLEGFNEQSLSTSDTSLADTNSPQTLYSPEFLGFTAQDSPGSGSTDSGIITSSSAPSSPILSPEVVDYADQDLLNNLLNSSNALSSSLDFMNQNQVLMKYLIEQQVRQALLEQQQENKEKLQQLHQEAQLKLQEQQRQQILLRQQLQRQITQPQAPQNPQQLSPQHSPQHQLSPPQPQQQQPQSLQQQLQKQHQPAQQQTQQQQPQQLQLQQQLQQQQQQQQQQQIQLQLQQQQQLHQQHQHLSKQQQQQLLLLAQQQQQQMLNTNIQNTERNKTDSQLRKMLQQTKDNIINTLHVKKVKNLSFKCHKSNTNNKLNKRKLTGLQGEVKPEKVAALNLCEGTPSEDIEMPEDSSVSADSTTASVDIKQPTTALLSTCIDIKQPTTALLSTLPNSFPKSPPHSSSDSLPVSLPCSISDMCSIANSSQSINLPISQPIISTTSTDKQDQRLSSDQMFIPQATSLSSSFLPSSTSTTTSSTPKVPITRLKPTTNPTPPQPQKNEEPKKTRVEHVVIEKRYRMKITDSLNELKCMLVLDDDKKPTKNSILQAAIIEIKRLKRENEALTKKYDKMKNVFDELRKIGILASQNVSCSSSESNMSDASNEDNKEVAVENVDPLVNQDHFVSPFQRQSARDGGKILTCFALFMFLCINPLSYFPSSNSYKEGGAFSSRHLMSVGDGDPSPHISLASYLFNIMFSLLMVMFMLLRGNPKCIKDPKITQCFRSQLSKAQRKIDRHEFEEAKGFIRIALFVIGNSCPKTLYGQLASTSWKIVCHMLYQLGLMKFLESIGYAVFPKSMTSHNERANREYTARLSAEAYRKLHEIALKDSSSTYLEAACYLMNAMYAAEISGDHELLCNAYTTAVVHMKEKLWSSYILRYYFTGCAHHASLASNDGCSFKVDWIFESRGYEFFASGLWDIGRESAFKVVREDSDLHEDDLLEKIYSQFQEHLLMKALRRIVVPERYYPNEGKIELRQRALSFLSSLGTGPVSEQMDAVSIYHQSLYGWWGGVLSQLIEVMKNGSLEVGNIRNGEELFEDIDDNHRHESVVLAKLVISAYIASRDLRKKADKLKLSHDEMDAVCWKVQDMLNSASQLLQDRREEILQCLNELDDDEKEMSKEVEMNMLVFLLCCHLLVEGNYILWQVNPLRRKTEKELESMLSENQVLHSFAPKYPELGVKAQEHDFEIQCLSGNNPSDMGRIMKRAKHIRTAYSRKDKLNGIYSECNHYPLKQDGFRFCR